MRRPRTPAKLSESIHQQINAYALAATAAGVGILASAQPTEAKIIYTPAHVVLTGVPHTSYLLDLNHDGINDFSISGGYYVFESGDTATLRCIPEGSLDSARVPKQGFVMALPAGVRVGSGERFNQSEFMGKVSQRSGATGFYGPWVNGGKGVRDRYLGLKFAIKGETHYGWARLNVKVGGQSILKATLTGYAYETVPNKSIRAGQTKELADDQANDGGRGASLTNPVPDFPQPTSLGALALGAPGLSIWRRSDSVIAGQ
jgi:hypothetical protein